MAGGSTTRTESKDERTKRGGDTVASARHALATAVWVLAVLAALVLALGALVVALDFNRDNAFVDVLTSTAGDINVLGELKTFKGDGAATKEALVNWGICALVYLVAGKLLDRVIRP